jgi:hypothetical protein
MAKDVTLSMGGDNREADDALDKTRTKMGQTGEAAKQLGDAVQQANRQAAAATVGDEGPDFGGLGKSSKKAASQVERLGFALSGLATGQVDLHEFTIILKDVTGSFGALATTAGKAGGAVGALAPVLSTVAGLAGPIGIAVAAGSALFAIWKGLNHAIEETPKKLDETAKRLELLKQQAEQIEAALGRAFAPKGADTTTNVFKGLLATANKAGPFGVPDVGIHGVIEALTQTHVEMLKRRGAKPSEESVGEIRKDTAKLLEDAAAGLLMAQERARDLFLQMHRFTGKPFEAGPGIVEGAAQVQKLFEDARAQVRKQGKDEIAKAKAEEDRKRQEEEDKKAEAEKREQEKRESEQLDQAFRDVVQATKAGLPLEAVFNDLTQALRQEGRSDDGIIGVIESIRKRLKEQEQGLAGLNRVFEQRLDEARAQHDREVADRQAEEKERQEQAQKDQAVIADHLQEVVSLLEKLNGDKGAAAERVAKAFEHIGLTPERAADDAGKAVARAGEVIEQQQLARGFGRAIRTATGDQGFGERFAEETRAARAKKGAALTPAEVNDIRKGLRDQIRTDAKEEFDALKGSQAKRRQEAAEEKGAPLGPKELADLARKDAEERRDLAKKFGPIAPAPPAGDRGQRLRRPAEEGPDSFDTRVREAVRAFREEHGVGPNASDLEELKKNVLDEVLAGLGEKQTQRREKMEVARGRPLNPAEKARLDRQEEFERAALALKKPSETDAEQIKDKVGDGTDAAREAAQNFAALANTMVGGFAQLAAAIVSMGDVAVGAGNALEDIRAQIPGPGTMR